MTIQIQTAFRGRNGDRGYYAVLWGEGHGKEWEWFDRKADALKKAKSILPKDTLITIETYTGDEDFQSYEKYTS